MLPYQRQFPKKLHLIEQLLKVTDNKVLSNLEALFTKARKPSEKKHSIHDFAGIFSKEETTEIKRIIAETNEFINKKRLPVFWQQKPVRH